MDNYRPIVDHPPFKIFEEKSIKADSVVDTLFNVLKEFLTQNTQFIDNFLVAEFTFGFLSCQHVTLVLRDGQELTFRRDQSFVTSVDADVVVCFLSSVKFELTPDGKLQPSVNFVSLEEKGKELDEAFAKIGHATEIL
jgi:hypothetical protein